AAAGLQLSSCGDTLKTRIDLRTKPAIHPRDKSRVFWLTSDNVGRGGLPPSPDDLLNSPATQEWLSLESQENSNSQPKIEPIFSQQSNNTVASKLIFSCQAR
ncbi:MAG: hypothetical protein HC847_14790, partial [Hydrococcus sp. RU_2_2]|nr:hypothetical protein [Hydrococcus sp. RU_2_2]